MKLSKFTNTAISIISELPFSGSSFHISSMIQSTTSYYHHKERPWKSVLNLVISTFIGLWFFYSPSSRHMLLECS